MVERLSVPAATESVRSHGRSSGPASGSCRAIPSPDAAEKLTGWPGARRIAWLGTSRSPGRRAETSEVLPCGSVAVAVRIGSPAGAVKGIAKVTAPAASVVSWSDPR